MQYTPRGTKNREKDGLLFDSLEPLVQGMGMSLVELSVSRHKGRGKNLSSVQIRVVVMSKGITGLDDCSKVHRGIMPRLSLAFPEQEITLEVSSPGIDRIIKDANEFIHYSGRGIRCYRTDISDWTGGVLLSSDEEKLVIKGEEGETVLYYDIIAKARLYGQASL